MFNNPDLSVAFKINKYISNLSVEEKPETHQRRAGKLQTEENMPRDKTQILTTDLLLLSSQCQYFPTVIQYNTGLTNTILLRKERVQLECIETYSRFCFQLLTENQVFIVENKMVFVEWIPLVQCQVYLKVTVCVCVRVCSVQMSTSRITDVLERVHAAQGLTHSFIFLAGQR